MRTSYNRGMRQALLWRTVAAAALLALSACGGGGENAGECFGSDEVCQGLTSVVTTPTIDLGALTCDAVLAIAGGSRPAAYVLAQQYFSQGATQLDGNDNDGDACEQFK